MRVGPWLVRQDTETYIKLTPQTFDIANSHDHFAQVMLEVGFGETVTQIPLAVEEFEELLRDMLEIRGVLKE